MKRYYIEVTKEVSEKIKILCFFKRIPRRTFAEETLAEELALYRDWFAKIQRIKLEKNKKKS